jgi:hypothetical protein
VAGNDREDDGVERKPETWWASRHGRRSRDDGALRRGRRITLIDVLLLAVIAGLLVPWILRTEAAKETDPYRISLSAGAGGNPGTLVLRVELPEGEESPGDSGLVGWTLFDADGTPFHEEADLAPTPGGSRRFEADTGGRETVRCEILLGGRRVVRELTMDEP